MDTLRIRQRLEKMNTPKEILKPSSKNQPFQVRERQTIEQPNPEDLYMKDLIMRQRVQQSLVESLPIGAIGAYKPKSHVTPQMIAEQQQRETAPVMVNGKIYKLHGADVPAPDLEPNAKYDLDGDTKETVLKEIGRVNTRLKSLQAFIDAYPERVKKADNEYNKAFNRLQGQTRLLLSNPNLINDEKEKYKLNKQILEAELNAYEVDYERSSAKLQMLYKRLQEIDVYEAEYRGQIESTRKHNKSLVDQYEETLKTLNSGKLSTAQQPDETEAQYLDRLKNMTAEIQDPDNSFIANRSIIYEKTKFKDNLKELIRDIPTIETVINGFPPDTISDINKIFTLIKTEYSKKYGTVQLNDRDMIRFIKTFLEKKIIPSKAPNLLEEDLNLIDFQDNKVLQPQVESIESKRKALEGKLIVEVDRPKALNKINVIGLRTLFNEMFYIVGRREFDNYNVFDEMNKSKNVLKVQSQGNTPTAIKSINKDTLIQITLAYLNILKDEYPDEYVRVRQQYLSEISQKQGTPEMFGEGFGVHRENLPKMVKFGKIELDLHKLFYKNILSISKDGKKFSGFKNTAVGDGFVEVIMKLCKGHEPTKNEVNHIQELQLYDALLSLAGLHKKIEHTASKSVTDLKKRLTLVEGEIQAGNTNKALLEELYMILYKLHHLGALSENAVQSHYKDVQRTFFSIH